MIPPSRALLAASLTTLLVSCGDQRAAPPAIAPTSAVPPGAVAICAGKPIVASAIVETASRRNLSPRQALDRLCDDARLAAAAELRGLATRPTARVASHAALARAVLHEVRAQSSGEPTQAELDAIRAEHWAAFDRPESVRTIHAVALAKDDDADARARARKVADAVAEAVKGVTDEETFRARAEAVPHQGVELRVEPLPPVTRDGRVVSEAGGTFDKAFAEGAFHLQKPGDLSPPVSSSFGLHVILLLERAPAYRASDDEIRRAAGEELLARRANDRLKQLLASARQHSPVAVERSAVEALSLLDPARRGEP